MRETYWDTLSFEKKVAFQDRCRSWLEEYNSHKEA